MEKTVLDISRITDRVKMECLGNESFSIKVATDDQGGDRIYLQVVYGAPCVKTGENQTWKGRKWYLSDHMTEDEIIKTAWCAFRAAVEHEIMEGFSVDGIILFNPHVDYKELLKISDLEVKRKEVPGGTKHGT